VRSGDILNHVRDGALGIEEKPYPMKTHLFKKTCMQTICMYPRLRSLVQSMIISTQGFELIYLVVIETLTVTFLLKHMRPRLAIMQQRNFETHATIIIKLNWRCTTPLEMHLIFKHTCSFLKDDIKWTLANTYLVLIERRQVTKFKPIWNQTTQETRHLSKKYCNLRSCYDVSNRDATFENCAFLVSFDSELVWIS
jgi:hypothetical protein